MPNNPRDDERAPTPRADEPKSTSPASARAYSRSELGLILQRASEQQARADAQSDGGFSMEDIRQIAGEVGIERRHVESAALALNARRPSDHPWLGAPWRFRFQETVDGELPNDTVAEIIDLARRETNMQGKVSQSLDSIEWVARESLGATFIEVTRRGGRTTITVLSARTDAAASVGIAGFVGAFFGAIGVSAALAASATLAVPAAIATGVVAAGGGAWLITRSAWRRIASRYSQRAELLVRVLAEHVKPDRAP